ncbi:MAG: hypothetical protein HW390_245 [Candidatus Brocadiaceae bacterium]|nr:hypothetical protein [Candidatus Brocadiaceae bacterium]
MYPFKSHTFLVLFFESFQKIKTVLFISIIVLASGRCLLAQENKSTPSPGNHEFYSGDYTNQGIIGNSLPGSYRPFSDDSPWNKPIPKNIPTHPDSQKIIAFAVTQAKNIRLTKSYTIPVWVVNSKNIPHVKMRSDVIFDTWDKDRDGWSDVGVPLTETMYPEPSPEHHLCIVDPLKNTAWEFGYYTRMEDGTPRCTTFNIWDLTGSGVGNPFEGRRWRARGGRASGFPLIAGLLRPEELAAGEIRHALAFGFVQNRGDKDDVYETFIYPPACRSDGKFEGTQYPVEGMRFQLDPTLGEKDFNAWGLNREGKIVARALQKYGMFLGDSGPAMALWPQLLGPSKEENLKRWEELYPGFYKNVEKIPTSKFRVLYTGEPVTQK